MFRSLSIGAGSEGITLKVPIGFTERTVSPKGTATQDCGLRSKNSKRGTMIAKPVQLDRRGTILTTITVQRKCTAKASTRWHWSAPQKSWRKGRHGRWIVLAAQFLTPHKSPEGQPQNQQETDQREAPDPIPKCLPVHQVRSLNSKNGSLK